MHNFQLNEIALCTKIPEWTVHLYVNRTYTTYMYVLTYKILNYKYMYCTKQYIRKYVSTYMYVCAKLHLCIGTAQGI